MTTTSAKTLFKVIAAPALVAIFFSMPMMGLFLPFIVLMQLLSIPWLAWVYVKRPQQRKVYAIKSVIWVLVPIAIFSTHFIRYKLDRAFADEVVSAINKFMSENHRCPYDLKEVQVSAIDTKQRLRMSGYSCSPRPVFYYSVGYAPFAMYNYDFDKQEWFMND